VTVVVSVSDTETARVGPCLDSLRGQSYRNLDIRIAPYGPAGRALIAAREHADADWRVRIEEGQADHAAAWNQGVARSGAPYVVLVRGGDDLPYHAVERMVTAIEGSGSDMVVGRVQPPLALHFSVDSPFEAAHLTELRRVTLSDTPVAVTDLGVGNRMLRRTFWDRAGLRVAADDRLGTQFALASYARAEAFDLLTDQTYIPTGRREGVSVGAVRDVLADLDLWLDEHDVTRAAIEALDLPDVMDWWLWGVLDAAVQPFLGDVDRAGDDQWKKLSEHVDRLVSSGRDSAWDSLRADSRVKLWLLREGRRDALQDYVAARLFERSHRRTEVRDGIVYAHLPFFGDPEHGVPDSAYVMGETETRLWATLHRIRWVTPERLELHGYVRIEHLDMPEDPDVRAWLVESGSGDRIALEVDQHVDHRANLVEGSRYQDFSRGAVTLGVDAVELASRAGGRPGARTWTLELEVRYAGLTRRGPLSAIDERASAGMVETGHLAARTVRGARVGPRGRTAGLFRIVAEPWAGPELVEASVRGGEVRGTLRAGATRVQGVRLAGEVGPPLRGRVWSEGDLTGFSVEVPRNRLGGDVAGERYALEVVDGTRNGVGVGWPSTAPQWLGVGSGWVALARAENGHTEVVEAEGVLIVERVELEPDAVQVGARWLGEAPGNPALRMVRTNVVVDGELDDTDGAVTARFPTSWDPWSLGVTPIPVGTYLLELDHGSRNRPRRGRVVLGEDVWDRLLEATVDESYRCRPGRWDTEARVLLDPPLADDERGPYHQARLQEWFQDCTLPIDDNAVYLQAYAGASATDSQLALHEEIRRRRPELTIYWGVAEAASTVPEGGTRVLMFSREWYRVMATARYLCLNIDPDRWFSLRPGQQLLQTFHGYPAKSMGIWMWEAKGYTPRRVDQELARTSAEWSLILTPAPEMDQYYRKGYRYDGPIHSHGYPRDDLLVSPEAEQVRAEVRARLGIAPDKRVVLYAPTWRDDLATNWRSAELTPHLDLEAASRALGPGYVMLLRGHRFHVHADRAEAGARLLDVTDYPEINHLILASDAAVLDYSSLRFDFALTQRPMVFLVPDLETYTGGVRGFLYPFEESAPGPLVATPDEVVAALRDLDRLREEYAPAMADFHRRFNYLQDGRSAESVFDAFFR
jgi:CDP-glycerol glycerophosphotransferase